ncbi:hypothetical protein F8R90_02930 [Nostoc sp. NZL]|nr:hypothetical protein [Nostoc sp. NZL]
MAPAAKAASVAISRKICRLFISYWVLGIGYWELGTGDWVGGMGKRTWGQGELGTRGKTCFKFSPLVPLSTSSPHSPVPNP